MKQSEILTYAKLWAWGEYEKAQEKLYINPDNKIAQADSEVYISMVKELEYMLKEEIKKDIDGIDKIVKEVREIIKEQA